MKQGRSRNDIQFLIHSPEVCQGSSVAFLKRKKQDFGEKGP